MKKLNFEVDLFLNLAIVAGLISEFKQNFVMICFILPNYAEK